MKIVIIGASSASLEFLVKIVQNQKYQFNNIELITEETWEENFFETKN